MVLTAKQRQDLDAAILEYLCGRGDAFATSVSAFAADAGLEVPAQPAAGPGLLEKKWTSVVRLQRKVLDLEAKLAAMVSEQSSAGGAQRPGREKAAGARLLPRAPAKHLLAGHRSSVTAVAMHPVYSLVASASEDASVRMWDLETGELEKTLKGHTNVVQGLAFSPDGALLASCSADVSVKLWNCADGTYECTRTLRGHDHTVSAVAWLRAPGGAGAGEGAHLASCGRDQTIRLWDATTGYCVGTLAGHDAWVRSVAAARSGSGGGGGDSAAGGGAQLLASGGNDAVVRVWTVGVSGAGGGAGAVVAKCAYELRGHTHVVESVAFSSAAADRALATAAAVNGGAAANGTDDSAAAAAALGADALTGGGGGAQHVVSGSRDKTVRVWSLPAGGACIATFGEHSNWVRQVAFHPCGAYALSCSDDRSVRVFDLKTCRCVRALEDAHAHFVTSLAMHDAAPYLATGGVDKAVHVWECH